MRTPGNCLSKIKIPFSRDGLRSAVPTLSRYLKTSILVNIKIINNY